MFLQLQVGKVPNPVWKYYDTYLGRRFKLLIHVNKDWWAKGHRYPRTLQVISHLFKKTLTWISREGGCNRRKKYGIQQHGAHFPVPTNLLWRFFTDFIPDNLQINDTDRQVPTAKTSCLLLGHRLQKIGTFIWKH